MDTIVHTSSDKYGDIIVIDQGQYQKLTFGTSFEQSSMDKNNPNLLVHEYMQAMMLALAFSKINSAAILGLGAGCLLRALHHLLPACAINNIELRHAVFEIARDYFTLPESNKIIYSICNAHQWLKDTSSNQFDLILSDLYLADGMDPRQQQKKFIYHCKRILTKKGWLVMNYHQLPEFDAEFFQCLASEFCEIFICPIDSGNNIIYASKSPIKILSQFDASVIALEKKLGTPLKPYFIKMNRLRSFLRD